MKKSYLHIFSVLAVGALLFAGCRSEVKLDQIDPTIEAQMKVALPVGSITAKVSDFLGTSDSTELYIDTLNGDGVVTWKRSFEYEEKLTDFDFSGKIGGRSYYANLYQQLGNVVVDPDGQDGPLPPRHLIENDSIKMPEGYNYEDKMTFNIALGIEGLNKPNLAQRLDSAQLNDAQFTIQLSKQDFNDLDWDWIDTIELDWGDNIKGVPNRVQILYTKGQGGSPEDKINIDLKNVTLDLVKDHNAKVGSDNVYDSVHLKAIVKYNVVGKVEARINSGSGVNCDFQVVKIDPKAFWGWLIEKPAYYGEELNIKYDPFTFLNGACLPLSSPRIDATLETPIAGNLILIADYLYTEDSAGVKYNATWDGQPNKTYRFTTDNGCIDPDTSALTAVAKIDFKLDASAENGDIDNLLKQMPRKLCYRVGANFDSLTTPQIRVVKDVYLKAKATAKVPIDFNKGVKIAYSDTIKGIKLEEANIDSLLRQVKWVDTMKTTNVNVYATIYNGIPLDVQGSFYCLDEDNQPIMDPNDQSKVWKIFDPETFTLQGGAYDGNTRKVIPAKSLLRCDLTKERLDLFPKIKSIVYTAALDDDCIKNAPFGAQINGTNNLKVTIGLTADITGVLNLNNIKE